ncbi:MAG: hypothetical protein WB681_00680 [Candidatus Cybelea sp.]
MFDDITKIQFALAGHYFEHLQAWQRIFARWMLTLAARTIATKPQPLACVGEWFSPSPPEASIDASQGRAESTSLHEMIQKSYDHDVASQKARAALRPAFVEADDRYFEEEGDESSELLPALVRFRERADFDLGRV